MFDSWWHTGHSCNHHWNWGKFARDQLQVILQSKPTPNWWSFYCDMTVSSSNMKHQRANHIAVLQKIARKPTEFDSHVHSYWFFWSSSSFQIILIILAVILVVIQGPFLCNLFCIKKVCWYFTSSCQLWQKYFTIVDTYSTSQISTLGGVEI